MRSCLPWPKRRPRLPASMAALGPAPSSPVSDDCATHRHGACSSCPACPCHWPEVRRLAAGVCYVVVA